MCFIGQATPLAIRQVLSERKACTLLIEVLSFMLTVNNYHHYHVLINFTRDMHKPSGLISVHEYFGVLHFDVHIMCFLPHFDESVLLLCCSVSSFF